MAYLHKYDIPFKMVKATAKPGSHYKKIPVLDVNGRQVNDTYIILKNLVPIVSVWDLASGAPPPAGATLKSSFSEEWEGICSYQLGPSIEMSLSRADAVKWMRLPVGFGPPRCLPKCCLASFLQRKIKTNIKTAMTTMPDRYTVLPLSELGEKLKEEIGAQNFAGGSNPGQIDISFYGVCAPFYAVGCENVTGMISECGLQEWWNRMELMIPLQKLFPRKETGFKQSFQFQGPRYWDARYQKDSKPFEWLEGHAELYNMIEQATKGLRSCKILHVGCGNSTLTESMYDDGYHDIVNIDNSGVVIEQMLKRNAHRAEMAWIEMDITQMNFTDKRFDLVIDKGVLDNLFCMEESSRTIHLYFEEVIRVLRPGGIFLCVSYGEPSTRLRCFNKPSGVFKQGVMHLRPYGWTLRQVTIPPPYAGLSANYAYICTTSELYCV